jgi:DNA-binding MarR family transcriptional regulator
VASVHKLIGEIIRAGARLAADRNALMISFGVTGAGLRLLKTLHMVRHPMAITGLARIMRVSRQTVRKTARMLEGAGFLVVESDPWNSKAFLVSLTLSGHEHLETLMRVERRWAKGLGRGFSEAVRAQTAWALRCVRERCTRMPRSQNWTELPAITLRPAASRVTPRPAARGPELDDLAALCRPRSRRGPASRPEALKLSADS